MAVPGATAADPAVALAAERFPAKTDPDGKGLPPPRLESGHLLGNAAHRRDDQPPGQLRGRVGRPAGQRGRGHDHAAPCAGLDVDVRVYADLTDDPEPVEAL